MTTVPFDVFQRLALRGALKLESVGMKHSSGRSAAQMIRTITGLKERNRKKLIPLYDQWLTKEGLLP